MRALPIIRLVGRRGNRQKGRPLAAPHKLNPTILREYDIRGVVDETLNENDVLAIGHAFGTILQNRLGQVRDPVCVGYDGRLSSPALADALSRGLNNSGLDVVQIGLGPTPMLYYAAHELNAAAGMMVTGSHNPPNYNGIKMVIQGHSFWGPDIQELGATSAAGALTSGTGDIRQVNVKERYLTRLLDGIEIDGEPVVAWDPGNGAGGEIVEELSSRLPGRHIVINGEIDGTFPSHHPDPTVEENLEQLKQTVLENDCDFGIGLDGDADRIGVVDAQGRVLWGDQLLILFAREVLATAPGAAIIADVKASQVLFEEVTRAGGKPIMWKSGHSLIKSKMAETGAPLAGEMSGHIFFADKYYGYDDAIYASLRLISILSRSSSPLSEIRDALPQRLNTPELRFDCDEDRKFEVVEEVRLRLREATGSTVHEIDGVRVENEDGWWLLRASNTQAVLVARCEAADAAGLSRLRNALVDQLRASGIEPPEF